MAADMEGDVPEQVERPERNNRQNLDLPKLY
jgi:hypothetical protein